MSFVFFFAGNRERIGILETWGLVSGPGSFGSNGLGIRIPVVLFAEKKNSQIPGHGMENWGNP